MEGGILSTILNKDEEDSLGNVVSLSSILRKIMESALLEAVSGHMKEVFGNS